MQQTRPTYPIRPGGARSRRQAATALAVDRAVYHVARHWLLAVNSFLFGYLALAALAPVLLAHGHGTWARLIYLANRPFCHQRDDRSFHLLGEKMACCQRCTAIYGGLALFGVAFVALRRMRALPWRGAVLLSLPMLIDGITQAVGLRDSSWPLRVATGAFFALALAWFAFPQIETGFAEMRTQLERRFARLVAQDRARPLRGAPPSP